MLLEMLGELIAHKGHANAALLKAVADNGAAADDPELWELLHHILLANRFWLLAVLGSPFVLQDESRRADSFDALVQRYARTQDEERRWVEAATEADLARTLTGALIPGGSCSVGQAWMHDRFHPVAHPPPACGVAGRPGIVTLAPAGPPASHRAHGLVGSLAGG
jgi:hypothetical protein